MRPRQGVLCLLTALLTVWSGAQPTSVRGDDPTKNEENRSHKKVTIVGTRWSSMETDLKGLKLPAGSFQLEFSKDGKFVAQAAIQGISVAQKGTYTLGEGDKVIFMMDEKIGGKRRHEEKIVIKDDLMTMTDSDGTSVTFTKVK